MPSIHWTGHPFVDAGLSALASAANVQGIEELQPAHFETAREELERVLLSDQALGIGLGRSFARSALFQIFPNSELVNPANWRGQTPEARAESVRAKFHAALESDLQRARDCFNSGETKEVCFGCGERCPIGAMITVRKDKMPLLEGIVNFNPAFAFGVRICGLCALAVRFLPVAVMRVGGGRRLWFLHTQSLQVAARIAQTYGWEHYTNCIARNEPLDFFSGWETAGDAGTVLYLHCELLDRFGSQLRSVYQDPLPTTAYLFSNDNRGGFVQALPVPHELMRFLAKLQIESPTAYRRFWRELLRVRGGLDDKERIARQRWVQSAAQQMLSGNPIIGQCLDDDTASLRGGWLGHRVYLQEVRRMETGRIAILERLGLALAQSEDAKRNITELRAAQWNELRGVFLGYIRKSWLTHEELYALLPPNDTGSAREIRDVLLAVIYEWQQCAERGEEFPRRIEAGEIPADETLHRLQQVGQRLIERSPNLSRWVGRLQTARSSDRIRGAYLNAVKSGALGFADFVFLAPLGGLQQLWLLRDYLLAFMFDRGRQELHEEDLVTSEQTTLED
jgi:CRISPR-associated protein Cst1